MLETEPFSMLIEDLHMPHMDGLQVLSVARRKYPQMRIVVLTGLKEEQFRSRAYAMGVDQYWIKPVSDQEMSLLMESIESMLSREAEGGFRGIQRKSLVDIIQLECLSQSSTLFRITNGVVEGRIWIQNGEVIDAEAGDLAGESAFLRILTWKSGSFENLPADPQRTRTIFSSTHALLLNTAQAIDEASTPVGEDAGSAPMLAELSQIDGVEFAMALGGGPRQLRDCWGLENPKPVADWMQQTMDCFKTLGENLQVGGVQHILGAGPRHKLALLDCGSTRLCIGFPASLPADELKDSLQKVVTKWAY
jgi:CheY-like chemotaxis protein